VLVTASAVEVECEQILFDGGVEFTPPDHDDAETEVCGAFGRVARFGVDQVEGGQCVFLGDVELVPLLLEETEVQQRQQLEIGEIVALGHAQGFADLVGRVPQISLRRQRVSEGDPCADLPFGEPQLEVVPEFGTDVRQRALDVPDTHVDRGEGGVHGRHRTTVPGVCRGA
jgi:hypothetical protein